MSTIQRLAEIITDCVLAAIALYGVYRVARYFLSGITDRVTATAIDPVDIQIWSVLAEARTITENAVKDTPDAAR